MNIENYKSLGATGHTHKTTATNSQHRHTLQEIFFFFFWQTHACPPAGHWLSTHPKNTSPSPHRKPKQRVEERSVSLLELWSLERLISIKIYICIKSKIKKPPPSHRGSGSLSRSGRVPFKKSPKASDLHGESSLRSWSKCVKRAGYLRGSGQRRVPSVRRLRVCACWQLAAL